MTTSRTGRRFTAAKSRRVVLSNATGSVDAAVTVADDFTEPALDRDLPAMLRRSANGDGAAFLALYDATAARAYGLGCRLLGDPVQAAEVVQEAYLNLWRHSTGFQATETSPISWILMAVHRCAVERIRSEARRPEPGDFDGQTLSIPACYALVESSSIQRQAVELAYYGGYTHTDVEQMCGLPAETARLRIRDGLLELDDGVVRG